MKSKWITLISILGIAVLSTACQSSSSAIKTAGSTSTSKPSLLSTGVGGASALIKMLTGDAAAKSKAKSQLLQLGVKALPALMSALKGGTNATKKEALDVVGSMGSKASSAKPVVKDLTKSKDKGVANAAMNALKKLGGAATSNPSQ